MVEDGVCLFRQTCPLWAKSEHRDCLLYHLVHAHKNCRGDCEADCFCGLKIDDKLVFRWGLNRKMLLGGLHQ